MKKPLFILALVAMVPLLPGDRAEANDFPTQARVEFVLNCMDERGGQSYDTLYPCICIVDEIASRIAYSDYTAAETLSFLYSTPGERGGIFRDAAFEARKRIKDFRALREDAEANCLIGGVANSSVQ